MDLSLSPRFFKELCFHSTLVACLTEWLPQQVCQEVCLAMVPAFFAVHCFAFALSDWWCRNVRLACSGWTPSCLYMWLGLQAAYAVGKKNETPWKCNCMWLVKSCMVGVPSTTQWHFHAFVCALLVGRKNKKGTNVSLSDVAYLKWSQECFFANVKGAVFLFSLLSI